MTINKCTSCQGAKYVKQSSNASALVRCFACNGTGQSLAVPMASAVGATKPPLTGVEAERLDLETARTEIANRVFEATAVIEHLAGAGKFAGNPQDIRQKIARAAVLALEEGWKDVGR